MDNGNGQATILPLMQNASGALVQYPVPAGTRTVVSCADVRNGGRVLLTPQDLSKGGQSGTIVPAENQLGEFANVRTEFQDGPVAGPVTLRVGFVNTSGGTVYPIIGDGNTIIYGSGRWAALPGSGFTITGTYGSNTLAYFRTFSANTPGRFTSMQLNFSSATFLSNGSVTSAYASLDGSVVTKDMGLATWQQPSDFQDLIVLAPSPFRLILDPLTAIIIGVPNGITVTATFTLQSVAKARDMSRVSV